ncbi:MAG: ATP-binding protein [Pseudomonadota bacterium]
MGALPRVINTTAVRLSAMFIILFGLCALLIIVYMTAMAANFVIRETRTAVESELGELADIYVRGGFRFLVRDIERRSRRPGAFVYLVADARGRPLAGNIGDIEPGILDTTGWRSLPFHYARAGEITPLAELGGDAPRAVAYILPIQNGIRIVVGRDLADPVRFRSVMQRSVGLALSIMGIGGMMIWFLVGRRALLRIDAVAAASDNIIAGDLSQRLPVSNANDEFDRLSTSLNLMVGRIEKLNDGLREVSDSIAHDLKTPLTRLRNRAEDAIRNGDSKEDYREALHGMLGEADNMIAIFNAMLLISRVEAGHTKFTPSPVNISEIAVDLCDLYEPVVEDAGGIIVNKVSGDLTVQGNRELIGQALTNLLDNAAKYGLADGGQITLSAKDTKDAITLSVADAGHGIPVTDRKRVLERFVRLDASRTSNEKVRGSGLGLSLVAAIMRQHQGSLELDDGQPGLIARLVFPRDAFKKTSSRN